MTSAPFSSPTDLTGRRVLVTGAAGGVGAAAARQCALQGAELVLVDVAEAADVADHVGLSRDQFQFHQCDTSDREGVRSLAAAVGPVYALIDCAAVCPPKDWQDDDWYETLDRTIAVDLIGPANLARAFLPGMKQQGEGRIVLFGSLAGWMGGLRIGAHYALAKGGVHSFVRWLAKQGAPHNVLANAIAPGPVDTSMLDKIGDDPASYPLQRRAYTDEVGAVAMFLCGPGAGYITGAVLDVNGGVYLR